MTAAPQRRWQDINPRRLVIGLSAGPVVLGALDFNLSLIFGHGLATAALSGLVVLAVSNAWFFGIGSAYLRLVPRRRGIIGRHECLLLGLAMGLPLNLLYQGVAWTIVWLSGTGDYAPLEVDPRSIAILGAFGLFAGWLLWRIGVAPSRPGPAADPAVFD